MSEQGLLRRRSKGRKFLLDLCLALNLFELGRFESIAILRLLLELLDSFQLNITQKKRQTAKKIDWDRMTQTFLFRFLIFLWTGSNAALSAPGVSGTGVSSTTATGTCNVRPLAFASPEDAASAPFFVPSLAAASFAAPFRPFRFRLLSESGPGDGDAGAPGTCLRPFVCGAELRPGRLGVAAPLPFGVRPGDPFSSSRL